MVTRRICARQGLAIATALAGLAWAASPAVAERAAAVLPLNALGIFDTATPATVTFLSMSGLGPNETVRGIDLRPADGKLYAVTVPTGAANNSILRTYAVDTDTGAVGAAYDRNVSGGTATTLFVVDSTLNMLGMVGGVDGAPSANGGLITSIGALGVTLAAGSDAGFDIASGGGAYAALTGSDGLTRLYTLDLSTGAATEVGRVGIGINQVRSLAILPPLPAPPPPPSPPPPPPPLADVTAPDILVAGPATIRLGVLSRSRVAFRASCGEGCTLRATLRSGRRVLARGSANLAEAGVARLRLVTSAPERRTIGRFPSRGGPARLRVTATDGAGNQRTVSQRVLLRR